MVQIRANVRSIASPSLELSKDPHHCISDILHQVARQPGNLPVASGRGAGNSYLVPSLYRHPDAPAGAIHSIDAELERLEGGAVAIFRMLGDISRLVIPPPADPIRADNLWRTTCF